MNSRTRIVYLLVALIVVVGLWAYWDRQATAQSFSSSLNMSIGVCNPHRAFQEYAKTKDLRESLRKQGDNLRQELEAKENELRTKTEELAASGFAPGSEEYEQRREYLVRLSIETKNFREISENELRREDMQITQIGYDDVYAAVAELAQKKQLSLVLYKDQFSLASGRVEELFAKLYYRQPVLYAEQALDITSEVIESLNTKYKLGH